MMSKGKFDLGLFGNEGVKTKNLVLTIIVSILYCRLTKKSINL